MKLVIYGAQSIALGTYKALKELHPELNIMCFLVTEMGYNSHQVSNLSVYELREFSKNISQEEKNDIEVLIATPENLMDDIEEGLIKEGFENVVRLDSRKWAKMQERAFTKGGNFIPLVTYPIGTHRPSITVFKMVHHKDTAIQNYSEEADYYQKLQVGSATTERVIADLQDNTLDNISVKNGNYSELTGLYWVWKNYIHSEKCNNEYIGLAHYRRFLELTEDDLKTMKDNDIDVILPYPMPYEPNIESHHKRYLDDTEWNAVLLTLKELEPEYALAYEDILNQGYMYNYNIIIAKSDILDNYCEWLFKILFKVEMINNQGKTKKPNRYIGYVAETLETLYFMRNKEKLKIAHTGCRFMT